jgi:hypothetical protein
MARPAAIDVTNYCSNLQITQQPPASKQVIAGQSVNISIGVSGATAIEWYRLGETQPIAGQTAATLTVSVTQKTTFWARVKDGTCSIDSATTTADPCSSSNTMISAPQSINANTEGEASVAGGAAGYVWSISAGGTITSGDTTSTVRFKSCTPSVTLTVLVTSNCGSTVPSSRTVNILYPGVTVTGAPQTIVQGQSATISAALTGAGPWSIKWSDGVTSLTRTESPSATTTYGITEINGCSGSYGSTTISVQPPAPTALSATALTPTLVRVTWVFSGTADSFAIDRCSSACINAGAWTTFTGSSPLDQTVAPNTAYVYRVRAVRANVSSVASNVEVATTVAFSTVGAHASVMRNDLAQVRTAVQALRIAAGQATTPFGTDDPFPAGLLIIKAVHFTELQSALNLARSELGLSQRTFLAVAPGGTIQDEHILDLRGGVQ